MVIGAVVTQADQAVAYQVVRGDGHDFDLAAVLAVSDGAHAPMPFCRPVFHARSMPVCVRGVEEVLISED
ncbi:hypothetical protein [Nocardia arthritidis]|uniref:Uncharacterized protein n=1 Tax=Nocardia arthritidis TaxID=228602 RepID=A0A6G9YA11_9NOCA|nr:hypothetical protein [Nocardia arthritidis]QIS09896.1 hypothetical protein F5544_09980 [Nocardia arthritidis]